MSHYLKAKDLGFSRGNAFMARSFISKYHYSKTCPPSQFYFIAFPKVGSFRIVGACVFRHPSLPSVKKAYGANLELVRLAMIDEAGKNAESRFIGWCLRYLQKRHRFYKRVISYADPRFNHVGTIYKASNFSYLGLERGHGTRRIVVDGKEWHSKSAYDKWGCSGTGLKKLLPESTVDIIICPPKHVYVYDLQKN